MTDEVRFVEATGKDVESAVAAGLAKLGLRRDEVIVEVLEEGSRGFLGLGGRQSTVRITPVVRTDDVPPTVEKRVDRPKSPPPQRREQPRVEKPRAEKPRAEKPRAEKPRAEKPRAEKPRDEKPAGGERQRSRGNGAARPQRPRRTAPVVEDPPLTEEEVARVIELAQRMVARMEADVTVSAAISEADEVSGRRMLQLSIDGDDLGALIGPRGDTLNAMQYLLRLMSGHALQRRVNLTLDIGGYRERRRQALTRLAERMAKKVLSKSRPVTLEPMPPFERRIIHMTLRESAQVYTNSVGEGERRRVRIYPKQ